MSLNEKLKECRKNKGLSQESVASILGVSRQAVTKWENGTSLPSSNNLIALSKLYDVSLEELIENKNNPKTNLILRNNLTMLAIIIQAASLNVAMRPLEVTNGLSYYLLLAFKYLPLLSASIWMTYNLHYEKNKKQYKKNVLIELAYCIIMLIIALFGHYTKLYFYAAILLIITCIVYIIKINPKYMNRQLVRSKTK